MTLVGQTIFLRKLRFLRYLLASIVVLLFILISGYNSVSADTLDIIHSNTYRFVSLGFSARINEIKNRNEEYFPLWDTYPKVLGARFIGNRPPYFNGLAYAYLNLVATTANVAIVQNDVANIT